jgi:hypothetical protein
MKKITFLFILSFGLSLLCKAQSKEIDVARHNEIIEILNDKNNTLKQQILDRILNNPNYYNPPVLYAVSRELFIQEKKDEAMYWFYVAQLRARYDSNLCLDNSAKQAVSILNNYYGPDINKYAFQDLNKLEKTVIKVVDFVKTNEENYDQRWINLHGMDAVQNNLNEKTESKETSEPKEKWLAIKKKTIDDYYNAFIEYVKNK